MEAIVIILLVFGFISSLSKKARETSGKGQGAAKRTVQWPKAPSGTPKRPHATQQPKAQTPLIQREQPLSQRAAMTPRVTTTPAEGMSSGQGEYVGSLGVASTEGKDICDPSLGHADETPPDLHPAYAAQAAQSVHGFRLAPEQMMQAVVMSEILTRPAQRKWGRR